MESVQAHLEEIEFDECVQLLADHHLGRLAVVVDDQPLVFPVNYVMSGRSIVFRTDPGTKLHAANGHRVAFEIDHFDARYHDGWSVLVVGTAHEEHEAARVRDLERLPLRPWCAGAKAHWMRVGGGAITGRRITHAIHP